jgi:hypothetical protein
VAIKVLATFRREVDVTQFATVAQVGAAASRVHGVTVNASELEQGVLWLEAPNADAIDEASEELLAIIGGNG